MGIKNSLMLIFLLLLFTGYIYTNTVEDGAIISDANSNYIVYNGARLAGADGDSIVIINNPKALDPTWDELLRFLSTDLTDRMSYDPNTFVCADYAEMLHNNAESAGIRAAYVWIGLAGAPDGHALNAFVTTDRGLVFIDCTAPLGWNGSADTAVDLVEGDPYIPECLFPEPGYSSSWEEMGIVTEIFIIQW